MKNLSSSLSRPLRAFIIIAQFLIIIIVLNYITSKAQSVSQVIINEDFINSETNKRQFFNFVNGLLCVQKITLYSMSWVILWCFNNIIDSRQKQDQQSHKRNPKIINQTACVGESELQTEASEDSNQNEGISHHPFNMSTKQQLLLGVLTFFAFQTFMRLQSSLNIIFMVISKYVNLLFILLFMRISRCLKKGEKSIQNGQRLRISSSPTSLFAESSALFVIVGALLVKVLSTELSSFYRSSAGQSPYERITLEDFVVWVMALGVDYVLYGWIFKVKERELTNSNKGKKSRPPKGISAIQLLNLWSKYTALCFFLYSLLTGQLFLMLSFITRHQFILPLISQLSFYHLISQCLTCYIILSYQPYIFFSLMTINGMFGKAYFHLFQSINLFSVPYYCVMIGLIIMLNQIVDDKIDENSQIKICSIEESDSKVYDFVEVEEKQYQNRDYGSQSEITVHSPNQIFRERQQIS